MVADLVARVGSWATRGGAVVLVGASGSGKSSLLRAGLLPALARGALPGSRTWPRLVMTPGEHPLETLVQLAVEATGMPTMARLLRDGPHRELGRLSEVVAEVLGTRPETTTTTTTTTETTNKNTNKNTADSADLADRTVVIQPPADRRLDSPPTFRAPAASPTPPRPRMVITVDQFEEVFTLCADPAERKAFVTALCSTAASSAVVVIGLRADFYGHCVAYPELVEILQANQVVVGPMTAAEIRDVVVNPARSAGSEVEPGLVELVLRDLGASGGTGAGTRPDGSGRMKDASGHANETSGYPDEEAGYDSKVLGFVADPGSLPLLAQVLRATWFARSGTALTVADYLRVGGLTGASTHGGLTGAIAHGGPTSASTQTAEAAHTGLAAAAPRRPDDATEVREHGGEDPSRAHRPRQLIAALTVLLLAVASLAGLAYQQGTSSARARDEALSQRIASQAEAARRDNPALAAQLSLVALRTAATPEARGAVLSSFNGGAGVPTRYQAHSAPVGAVTYSLDGKLIATGSDDWTAAIWEATDPTRLTPLARIPDVRGGGHDRAVKAVAFDRDASVLATGGADGLTKLWDITDRTRPRLLTTLPKASSEVYGLAFDPTADRLVVGGYGNTAYLFDVSDPSRPKKLGQLYLHLAQVVAVMFSPDGKFLVAGDSAGSALLWFVGDPTDPTPITLLVEDGGPGTEGTDPVRSVAFGGDGRTIYTAGDGGYVRRFTGPDLPRVRYAGRFGSGDTPMTSVTADPTGDRVAVGGFAFAGVPIFEVGVEGGPRTFLAEGATSWASVFSPDGRHLASVSADGSLRIWEMPGPALIGLNGSQQDAAVSQTTGTVAITTDVAVELWDVTDTYAPKKLSVITDAVVDEVDPTGASAFSPDGTVLAVSTGRNIVWYDVTDPAKPARISDVDGPSGGTSFVTFSPDGATLAVGGLNAAPEPAFQARVETWDVSDLTKPRRLASVVAHRSAVRSLDFSPDGRALVTVAERSTRIWDVSDPRRIVLRSELPESPGGVWEARFSPTGTVLAVGGDPFATLWDVRRLDDPVRIADLPGHAAAVTTAVFSPDGTRFATGSSDNTVRVWDVTDPADPELVEKMGRSAGPESGVGRIRYLPDGQRLVGVVFTEPAVVWDLDVDRVRARICARAGIGITEAEWRRFLPDLPYDPVCD